MEQGGRGGSGLRLRIGFALDVAGYGARTVPERAEIQRRLRQLVVTALGGCGLPLDPAVVDHQWTGDGINAILPADIDPTIAVPVLIRSMAAGLARDNARCCDRIRLRLGIGVGLTEPSAAGYDGPLIVDISRLVDSATLRAALAASPAADLAAAISSQLYDLVIKVGYPGIPPGQFTKVNVTAKEFSGPAWIWVSARQWSEPAYSPLTPADPRQAGGHRIVARLGSGVGTRVYLAAGQTPGGGWTAVKVFGTDLTTDQETRRRLVTGALAASVVRGPHLASVTGSDTGASQPWVASTLVRGPSLAATVAETGPLPADSAAWLALGLARAVATLAESGLSHHAITPHNVLLDADGPVLTDFGISRAALTSAPGTAADDVLQLGAAVCHAVTGRSPWDGSLDGPLPLAGPHGEPDLAGCPPALAPVLKACLAADPAARPAAARLHAWLADVAGPRPRLWLPGPVRARLAEYRELPPPRPRPRRPR